MAGLTDKERRKLEAHLAMRGCTLDRTKSGTKVAFPNGNTTSYHWTASDSRSIQNLRADIRRNGIDWPFDKQPRRKDRAVSAQRRSHREVRRLVKEGLHQQVGIGPSTDTLNPTALAAHLGVQLSTVVSHLRDMGWHKSAPAKWERLPEEALPEPGELTIIAEPITEPVAAYPPEETAEEFAQREFIDTHDSWTVKLTTSIAEATVGDLHKHYRAAGLRMEIRVWKDTEEEN